MMDAFTWGAELDMSHKGIKGQRKVKTTKNSKLEHGGTHHHTFPPPSAIPTCADRVQESRFSEPKSPSTVQQQPETVPLFENMAYMLCSVPVSVVLSNAMKRIPRCDDCNSWLLAGF